MSSSPVPMGGMSSPIPGADEGVSSTATGNHSFMAPAQIRILLVPTAHCTPADFDKWCQHIRTFETIRLADLPRSQTGRAVPPPGSPLANHGDIHISWITAYDTQHAFLAPFALHTQPLGILGVGTYTSNGPHVNTIRDAFERAPSSLRELHPAALVHRVFAFDTGASRPETQDLSAFKGKDGSISPGGGGSVPRPDSSGSGSGFGGRSAAGLVVFPAVRKDGRDVKFYLKTLLPDFFCALLDGLDSVVSGLQSTSLETPRETLDGIGASALASTSSAATAAANPLGSVASNAASRASALFSSIRSTSDPSGLQVGTAPAAGTKAAKSTQPTTGIGPTGAGRLAKVKADAALLSGDLWAALTGYDAAASHMGKERALAGGQDAVWYAGALEGWAVAKALVCRQGGSVAERAPCMTLPTGGTKEKDKKDKDKERETETPFTRTPWGDIAEAYSLALTIYSKCLAPPEVLMSSARSVTNETPRDHAHPLIHAWACISYARFLLAVWASGGWNGECFDQLLYGGVPPELVEPSSRSRIHFLQLTAASAVQRSDVAAAASAALTYSVAALKPPDYLAVLSALASIYNCIGYERREAYVLRQLQASIIGLIAQGIINQQAQPDSSFRPLEDAVKTELGRVELGTLALQILHDGTTAGIKAVLLFALHICRTYGVAVDLEPLQGLPSQHLLASQDGNASLGKVFRQLPGAASDFGWTEQQLEILKDAIAVSEMLGDHIAMAFFGALLLRDHAASLSPEEQWRVAQALQRVVGVAKWRGAQELEARYWGPPQPVCSIEMEPLPTEALATEHPIEELAPRSTKGSGSALEEAAAGVKNPFFWKPNKAGAGQPGASSLVQGEVAAFLVTLQNPLTVPLEVTSLRLSTSGVPFDAQATSTIIPAESFQTIRLRGTPLEAGRLVVRGCFFTLMGCAEQEFTVSLMDAKTRRSTEEAASEAHDRRTRIKHWGLDGRPTSIAQRYLSIQASEDPEYVASKKRATARAVVLERYLDCRVIPKQPLLAIASTSLTHGGLTLFDGEVTTLRIRLANEGSLPVEHVQLSFTDDLTTSTLSAIAEGDLLASDAHDLEWDLVHRPVFTFPQADTEVRIEPSQTITLRVTVRGKLDCTRGAIRIDYAHIGEANAGGSHFFTRVIALAVGLTVLPVLECGALELMPLEPETASQLILRTVQSASSAWKDYRAAGGLRGEEEPETDEGAVLEEVATVEGKAAEYALLSLDVRNIHAHFVKLSFVLKRDGGQALQLHRLVPPGSTTRLLLPISRVSLEPSRVASAIPSLSPRQFVVSRVQHTAAEQAQLRKRFWYREELLRSLELRWEEHRTPNRTGEVPLRSLECDSGLVDALARREVDVRLNVEVDDGGAVRAESMVSLVAKVLNLSARPLKLQYRLLPPDSATTASAASQEALAQQLLVTGGTMGGVLSPWPLPAGGGEGEVRIGMCFMSAGRYEVVVLVEEVEDEVRGTGEGRARVQARSLPLVVDVQL